MNVLYILGNGFDKAQGMKTSYPEFYEYLKTIDSETEGSLLNLMKKEIKADKVLWPVRDPCILSGAGRTGRYLCHR